MTSPLQSFEDLGLSTEVMQAIRELGFETPSPIQAETLPILLKGSTDFIGQAATGTGKTAAFAIPLIERIDPKVRSVQGLILCPTRELAMQVSQQVDLLGKFKGIRSVAIYGGSGYEPQIQGLKQGRAIVVGTPGRIIDHLERKTLKLDNLQTVILDEADEMISMGFKEELEAILENTPDDSVNTWLFSATMSREVHQVADKYLDNPAHVTVSKQEMLPSAVEQVFFLTHEANKPEVLCKIIDAADQFYGLVFCQTKALVDNLTKFMQNRGYRVDCLHGDMTQASRERTLTGFRNRHVQILVCTDVASRGIDVKDLTHVVNYSIPRELDVYVHRIGRTARSGKTGIAVSLVTPSHRGLIRRIEQMTRSRMIEGRIPGRKEIALKKVSALLPTFQEQKWHARAVESMDQTWRDALNGLEKEEIAGRFLALMLGDLFTERQQEALSRSERPTDDGDDRAPRRGQGPRGGRDGNPRRRDGRDSRGRDGYRGGHPGGHRDANRNRANSDSRRAKHS